MSQQLSPSSPGDHLGWIQGWLFDLDGVITATAEVHRWAWAELLGAYFVKRGAHRYTEQDYFTFIDGKSRYDGVRSVLASRGISLPEGDQRDSASLDTICGLGNVKNALFLRRLETTGVRTYPGTLALIDTLIRLDRRVAVVSSSRNANVVLGAAGIVDRFHIVIDGCDAADSGLAGKPAADTYLRAAELLTLDPAACAVLEDAESGVRAGRNGRFGLVVGVDRGLGAPRLHAAGAQIVVAELDELLPMVDQ